MSKPNLAVRMKAYEETFHNVSVRRLPVMIRVDGRAFHSLNLNKPFDPEFMDSMLNAAVDVARDMQGFKAAYIQSDEASFALTDYDTHDTQGWFNYDVSKMVSISAAMMSVHFNRHHGGRGEHAVFDSRVFSLPEDDVVNAFLWRAKDWERNSLQMYARAHFSHRDLHGKKRADLHEILHSKGLNWASDLTDREMNGIFLIKSAHPGGLQVRADIRPRFDDIHQAIGYWFSRPTEVVHA